MDLKTCKELVSHMLCDCVASFHEDEAIQEKGPVDKQLTLPYIPVSRTAL